MVISVESGKGRFSGNICVGVYYVQNSGLCLEVSLEVDGKEREREKYGKSRQDGYIQH